MQIILAIVWVVLILATLGMFVESAYNARRLRKEVEKVSSALMEVSGVVNLNAETQTKANSYIVKAMTDIERLNILIDIHQRVLQLPDIPKNEEEFPTYKADI